MKLAVSITLFTFLFFSARAQQNSGNKSFEDYERKVIGTWEMTKITNAMNGKKESQSDLKITMTFFSDGIYKMIEFNEKNEKDVTKGTYKIIGDKIITDYGKEEQDEMQITQLTNNKMTLYQKDDENPNTVIEAWFDLQKQP